MQKKLIAGLVIVALLGTGGWWFISRRAAATAGANAVRYIQEPVKRGLVRLQVTGSGPVRSVNGVTVKASQSGTVVEILAGEGERVQEGQPVIRLENKSLMASLAQSQLDLQNARTNLQNLLHPQSTAIRAQELKVESARVTLQQRQEDVANLQVSAPAAGVIASVGVVTGGSVNVGALLFTIYDESSPTLIVPLPQETASALKSGDKASVTLAGHGTLEGVVVRRGGTATPLSSNRDANVPVAIDLPPAAGIRPGMVGQVTMQVPGLTYRIQGSGSIENDAEEVRARVSGTVDAIRVAEGDLVAMGQPLLTLTNDSLRVQLKQAENDLQTQEQALAHLTDPARDPDGQLLSYQQKLEQAELTLAQRQSDVADLSVRAPVSGTLSAIAPKIGERVSANSSLFRVADYTRMEVTISVDELDVARIKVGQPAEITLDALPGKTYKGQVTRVNPEGTFKNDIATFEVTVSVDAPEGLMSGMNASVNITVENREEALYLPVAAVRILRGKAFVNLLENGQVVQKEIQVGVKTNDRYELLDGLKEGDPVIVTIIRPQSMRTPFGGGGGGGDRGGSSFGPPGGGAPGGQAPAGGSRP